MSSLTKVVWRSKATAGVVKEGVALFPLPKPQPRSGRGLEVAGSLQSGTALPGGLLHRRQEHQAHRSGRTP